MYAYIGEDPACLVKQWPWNAKNRKFSFSMNISAMRVPKVANDLQHTLLFFFWYPENSIKIFFLGAPKFAICDKGGWVSLKKMISFWVSSTSAFRAAIKPNSCPFYWHRTNNETRISDEKRGCVIYSSSWQILFKPRCNIYQGTLPWCSSMRTDSWIESTIIPQHWS